MARQHLQNCYLKTHGRLESESPIVVRLWRCGPASYGSSPGRQPTRLRYRVTATSLNQVVQRVA
jgi:hypothetical protein